MEQYRLLIIEDDPAIGQSLLDALHHHGFSAELRTENVPGIEYAKSWMPHLIILDIRLPDRSGFDVCRQMRRIGLNRPIIMLTAQHHETDKVLGLAMGWDSRL